MENGGYDTISLWSPGYVRGARLRWAGYVQRMVSNEMAKRMMENTPMEKRKVGRPISRWMDNLLEGIKRLKITN